MLEGKYCKRRLESLAVEYNRWRLYAKRQHMLIKNEEDMQQVDYLYHRFVSITCYHLIFGLCDAMTTWHLGSFCSIEELLFITTLHYCNSLFSALTLPKYTVSSSFKIHLRGPSPERPGIITSLLFLNHFTG